jgi:hypothetical protein
MTVALLRRAGGWALVALLATEAAAAAEQLPRSCGQAVAHVRSKYRAERIDTSRSSFVTSAEYFDANGEGYLILGLNRRPYIYRGVPVELWRRFKAAESFGRFYNQHIKGRYLVDCRPP